MASMPAVFFGHGSPTIAIEDTDATRAWKRIAADIGRPTAILSISAHWLTRGTGVTAMTAPATLHDFGGFPQLRHIRYPAPGHPGLAAQVAELLAPEPVHLDEGRWGLDHGSWSVLVHAFPEADVPVVQLSMDAAKPPAWHFEAGRRLQPLRDEGVLIMGTGNVVHNLGVMDWNARYDAPYDWAERFHRHVREAIEQDQPQPLIDYQAGMADDARLAQPSPDHYWPLLYVLGARRPGDRAIIGPDHIEYRSISMLSAVFDGRPERLEAA